MDADGRWIDIAMSARTQDPLMSTCLVDQGSGGTHQQRLHRRRMSRLMSGCSGQQQRMGKNHNFLCQVFAMFWGMNIHVPAILGVNGGVLGFSPIGDDTWPRSPSVDNWIWKMSFHCVVRTYGISNLKDVGMYCI